MILAMGQWTNGRFFKLAARTILLLACAAAVCSYILLRPAYGPDTVAYLVLAESLNGVPAARIPAATNSLLQNEAPSGQLAAIRQDAWAAQLLRDIDPVRASLPVFSAKFGYVFLVSALQRAGLRYTAGMRLINASAATLLFAVMFLWMRGFTGFSRAIAASMLVLFSPLALGSLKALVPDPLAASLAVVGLWAAFQCRKALPGLAFLALSVAVRPDSAILFAFSAAALYWLEKERRKRFGVVLLCLLAGGLYLWTQHLGHAYPWGTLVSVALFAGQPFTFLQYAVVVLRYGFVTFTESASIFLFCAIGVLSSASLTAHQRACAWVQVLCLIRFLVYPAIAPRFFLVQNLVMLVLVATLFLRKPELQREITQKVATVAGPTLIAD